MDVQSYRFVNIVENGHLFTNFYTCWKITWELQRKEAKQTTGEVYRCEVKTVGNIISYRLFTKCDLILINTR